MRRKWIALILAAAMTVGVTACGSGTKETAKTEANVVTEDPSKTEEKVPTEVSASENEEASGTENTPEEEVFEYEGDAASYYVKLYGGIIGNYHFAMKEEWAAEELLGKEMSLLCMDYYGENGMDQVGYGFLDLDGDGEWELVIGSEKLIFDAYAYKDGVVSQIFCGEARNRYYISADEAAGYLIANEGSSGAMNSAWIYSRYDGTKLQTVQSVVYDADADSENPWFMGSDDDGDVSNDTPVDEQLAKELIDSYTNSYIQPEYLFLRAY